MYTLTPNTVRYGLVWVCYTSRRYSTCCEFVDFELGAFCISSVFWVGGGGDGGGDGDGVGDWD